MKSMPTCVSDADDDMFGPPRAYTPYCASSPRQRPSMISAKYRQKEERRKVLKISVNKLRRIEDPESSLCRSVLINNTMKRLQKETKDEKLNGQTVRKQPVSDFAIDIDDLVELNYSRKRPVEEVEDCDVHDVLSQFYMPPTPRMLTGIDDDEVDAKRPRFDEEHRDSAVTAPVPTYSCGHASMFNELQNNVFHSLVASLET